MREITRRHGIVLIFDEVKTGLCIAAGGATERFGIEPDMVTLAKTLGGGLPSGAIGGTEEVFEVVEDERVYQVGTYNGNPLSMAAARASLLEVMTPEAYEHLDALNERILGGWQGVIERYGLSGYAVGVGAKGCVTFSPEKIVDYETYKANQDGELADLAWLYNMNRGVFMTPGREEEWTLSVVHSFEDCDVFVAAFRRGGGSHRVEFGHEDRYRSRSRGRRDASGRLVRGPGDPAARGRAHLRADVAVRRARRPGRESRRLLHVLRGPDPDRGRPRHRGRSARIRQRLPAPRAPDRAGRRQPQGAPVPVHAWT